MNPAERDFERCRKNTAAETGWHRAIGHAAAAPAPCVPSGGDAAPTQRSRAALQTLTLKYDDHYLGRTLQIPAEQRTLIDAPLCVIEAALFHLPRRHPLARELPPSPSGFMRVPLSATQLQRAAIGFAVFMSHGLVTAPACVDISARTTWYWRTRVITRIMTSPRFRCVPVAAFQLQLRGRFKTKFASAFIRRVLHNYCRKPWPTVEFDARPFIFLFLVKWVPRTHLADTSHLFCRQQQQPTSQVKLTLLQRFKVAISSLFSAILLRTLPASISASHGTSRVSRDASSAAALLLIS